MLEISLQPIFNTSVRIYIFLLLGLTFERQGSVKELLHRLTSQNKQSWNLWSTFTLTHSKFPFVQYLFIYLFIACLDLCQTLNNKLVWVASGTEIITLSTQHFQMILRCLNCRSVLWLLFLYFVIDSVKVPYSSFRCQIVFGDSQTMTNDTVHESCSMKRENDFQSKSQRIPSAQLNSAKTKSMEHERYVINPSTTLTFIYPPFLIIPRTTPSPKKIA